MKQTELATHAVDLKHFVVTVASKFHNEKEN
jgi:hypothetical protein